MSLAYHDVPSHTPPAEHTYGYLTPSNKSTANSMVDLAPQRSDRRSTKPVSTTPWRPPSRKALIAPALTIGGCFVVGCLLAVGHHVYNASLDGKDVSSTTALAGLKVYDQTWANHVGTAFAYLVKFFFTMAIGAAYLETLWQAARQRSGISISGLDASFTLLNNPMSFLSMDLILSARVLLVLGALSWLVPFVSVFSPGALTVTNHFLSGNEPCSIPTLELGSVFAANNLGSYSQVDHTGAGDITGPSQTLQRLITTTLLGGTYQAPLSPCDEGASQCAYSTSFSAPYFECSDPVQGNYTGDLNFKQTGGTTWFNTTYYSDAAGDHMTVAWLLQTGDFIVNVVQCSTMNATYNVNVAHTASTHTVDVTSVVVNGVIASDDVTNEFPFSPLSDPQNSNATRSTVMSSAVMLAISDVLSGSIVASDSSSPELTITANNTMVGMSNFGTLDESEREFIVNPNYTIPELVVSFITNVSIGLMAANISDKALETTCMRSTTEIVYLYTPRTLVGPYIAAAVASLLACIVGLNAIWRNQEARNTSFTTMIHVTRNPALDAVPENADEAGKVRLRYGLVSDEGGERMAFGQLWNFEGSTERKA